MSIEININNRQPSPGVLNLFSHERDSRVIEFILENYRYNEKDLSKYKAYVSTAVNGKYDLVELTSFVEEGKLKVIWNLRDYTFPQTGAILYQLCFKGDDENATAYYTYKAVIVNRETLDAEHQFPCDYPTIMQQWIDHMHTLSREFGSDITYMYPGQSIPVEERLGGRLYYQWLDVPTSRATAATGIVNLGERPHGDSGLYINDVHVYVDDSDEGVYVIDPNVWVNAINNADCGVFATDISAGDEIILLLTAKNVGASGNSIGLKLDVALYGDGKGETNPSGGHVSGSTLTGGSDNLVGGNDPRGHFEDGNGNILNGNMVGEVKWLAHNNTPAGWLLCDGSEVSRTTYSKLFSAIGTTWGEGDGSSTFALPNLIGRVAWGATTAGQYKEAGLPNITGNFNAQSLIDASNSQKPIYSGALYYPETTEFVKKTPAANTDSTQRGIAFDASMSNPIYGNSDTVQPPAATLRPFIKY